MIHGRAEVADTLADPTRLRRLIGWVPVTDLDQVVARQLAAGSDPIMTETSPADAAGVAEMPVLVRA